MKNKFVNIAIHLFIFVQIHSKGLILNLHKKIIKLLLFQIVHLYLNYVLKILSKVFYTNYFFFLQIFIKMTNRIEQMLYILNNVNY
jgi:hypothetical protein